MINIIKSLALNGYIRQLDYQFGRFMSQQTSTQQELIALISTLLSYELGKGNVCINLHTLPVHELLHLNKERESNSALSFELTQLDAFLQAHPVSQWQNVLQQIPCVGSKQPLIINNNYLYLNRYWQYENQLAETLRKKSAEQLFSNFKPELDQLFTSDNVPDWQKIAAAISVSKKFAVISGGPGTGKTTTVSRILALLIQLYVKQGIEPVIKLAAPTGKAAARLNESLGEAVKKINLAPEYTAQLPVQASTIHRLMRTRSGQSGFLHTADNPLIVDVLIIDEASMVDLPLMSKLVMALPEHAQLILLGDKDQLSSVEAGSVLGDICSFMQQGYSSKQLEFIAAETGCHLPQNDPQVKFNTFSDCLCQLKKSYRFEQHSGIGQLAKAVNAGEVNTVECILNGTFIDIDYFPPADSAAQIDTVISLAIRSYRAYLQKIKDNETPALVIQAFNQFRVLCATRHGPFGVSEINENIQQQMIRAGLVEKSADENWYIGRPVIMTRNNYELELYNGDIGITMKDKDGHIKVYFDTADKSIKAVSPGRLSECETVYAMTVHKSQGSEFNHVAFLFPAADSPLLARELLYTGITRAKINLSLFSSMELIRQATVRKTARVSGLQQQLMS